MNKKLIKNKKTQKNRKIKDIFNKISYFFEKFLYPDDIKCIFCGKDIPNFYEKPYCNSCEKSVTFNKNHTCKICALPIKNEAQVCDFCQTQKRYFKKAFIPFLYQGKIRESVLSFKFDNRRYLAKGFAVEMAKLLKCENFDFITFVPMTLNKLKERGFNQAEKLANELSNILHIPCFETLKKNIETKEQKNLTYMERSKNLENAFTIINKDLVENKKILLVDDIVTTCATVNACACKLSKYTNNIYVSAIARNEYHEN